MGVIVLQAIGLFLAGILAGEEFIVRYGVQPALSALEDRTHIQARQALVRRLRVLVPIIMIPTVLVGIAVIIFSGTGGGIAFRWAGVIALITFVLLSFLGTVPINIQVDSWQVDNPPPDWKATVERWKRIDVFRSSAAIIAFGCFLIALAVQVP
jgi:uncharacterized membrane protein